MLQLKNLLCARNDTILFKKIDCVLQPGQCLEITGSNGSGKSTLLRTIAGFLRPYSGQIIGETTDLCYVGHKSGLHPDLSVWQNLLFLQAFLRTQNNVTHETLVQALKVFNLQSKVDHKLSVLSAGQMQQVSLTRLCMATAKLWILDEPCAHLDNQAIQLLQLLCVTHLQSGGMLVLATHNKLDLAPYIVQNIALEN